MKRLLALLLALPLSLVAATLRVNNAPDTSPDHPTIQAAIDAASDGDTVLIEGSVTPYAGFTLLNKRLNLIGPGYGLALNLGTPANKLAATIGQGSPSTSAVRNDGLGSANGSLIMGLEFIAELRLENCSHVTIARCGFPSPSGGRIHLGGPENVVRQCFIGGSPEPIYLDPFRASGTRIENCLLPGGNINVAVQSGVVYLNNNLLQSIHGSGFGGTFSADNNIFLSGFSMPYVSGTFRNNLFYGGLPSGEYTGSGNRTYESVTSLMENHNSPAATFDGRYQLAPLNFANPAFNAGADGTHIGPFGGANPYILSGVPPLPTIDELSVPQFAAPGGDLIIRVKVGERP